VTLRNKIWFTPEKANRTLPFVRPVVQDILEKGRELRGLMEKDDGPLQEDVRGLQADIAVLINELERIGCSYRDWNFEIGLVDFPAVMNGEEVCLCWRSDEEEVTWYHTPESGYAGRKQIPKALLKGGSE
jgi:hypothetical protein